MAAPLTLLCDACAAGDVLLVDQLLKQFNGVPPEALWMATKYCKSDVVEHLVKRGACTSTCNKDGWTPLHRACGNGDAATVRALLDGGADVNARRREKDGKPSGVTPLFVAVRRHPRRRRQWRTWR